MLILLFLFFVVVQLEHILNDSFNRHDTVILFSFLILHIVYIHLVLDVHCIGLNAVRLRR